MKTSTIVGKAERNEVWTPVEIAKKMVALLNFNEGTTFLEPSAGDGRLVKELIAAGVSPSKITAIEINPLYTETLEKLGVRVICGSYFDNAEQYDVVLANPPYIIPGSDGIPFYHLFFERAADVSLAKQVVMITPSRWMAGGSGLSKYRKRMMQDKRLKVIQHFPGEREVFPEVSIKGGVSYFLWDREYSGKCLFNGIHRDLNEYDIVPLDNESLSILDKVIAMSSMTFLHTRCYPSNPFSIKTNYQGWKTSGTKCIARNRAEFFVSPSDFTDAHGLLNNWKVCTSEGTVEGSSYRGEKRAYISRNGAFVIEPGVICTQTYIVVNTFDNKKEAENFVAYMQTKFFRFMLGLRVITQHINKEKFAWVPDLGSYKIAPTDAQLYKMFGLTQKEVDYIEARIKPTKNPLQ